MGQHKGELLKLEHWLKDYFHQDSMNLRLLNIYPRDWHCKSRPLSFDFVAQKTGKTIYIDIVGNDDWRQLIGKAVAYSFELKSREVSDWEIWLLTDFSCWKEIKRLSDSERTIEVENWKKWYARLQYIIREMLGPDFAQKVFLKYRTGDEIVDIV